MKKVILSISLLISVSAFSQQSKLDSLQQLLTQPGLSDTTWVIIKNEIAKQHRDLYFSDSALRLCAENLAFIEKKKIHRLKPRVLNTMAYTYFRMGHLDSSIKLFKTTLAEAIRYSDSHIKYYANKGLGQIYLSMGHSDSVIYYFNKCLEQKSQDKQEVIWLTQGLAQSYLNLGNYQMSLQYQLKALEDSQEIQHPAFISRSLNDMGVMHFYLKNFKKSLWYYLKALKITEEKENKSTILMNISEVYSHWNKGDSAIYYASQSVDILKGLKAVNTLAYGLHYLSIAYKTKKEWAKSLSAEQEAFKLHKDAGDRNGSAESANGLGEIYFTVGQFHEATVYATTALKLAKEIQAQEIQKKALYILATTFAQIEKHAIASQYWQSYDSLNKILNDKLPHFADIEALYENNKKAKAITLLTQKASFQEMEIKQQKCVRNYTLAGAGILLVLLSVIFYLFRQKRKTAQVLTKNNMSLQNLAEKLKKAVADKNVLLKEIHHRVKNNLQIINSLLNLQSSNNSSDTIKAVQGRITSMALIHKQLYTQDNLEHIEFLSYAKELMQSLRGTYLTPHREIDCLVEGEEFKLNADAAIPLGLILFELITNSFKYAFNNSGSGNIGLNIDRMDSSFLAINYYDSGPGLPPGFDVSASETLGVKLIVNLAEQLDGRVTFFYENGYRVKFIFNLWALQKSAL
jgi:two-component sensor histidine kinase